MEGIGPPGWLKAGVWDIQKESENLASYTWGKEEEGEILLLFPSICWQFAKKLEVGT